MGISIYSLFLAALLLRNVPAFVYPREGAGSREWESVEAYRKRLNITYSYQPKHIHPELCRYVSEETCQADDEAAAQHAEDKRQRRLNPSTGAYTFLILLVQFPDHADRVLPPKEYYEELCNGSGSSINEIGSISEYIDEASYGNYNITCVVEDWRFTNDTEAFYAKGVSGRVGSERGQDFFVPVLEQIEAESGSALFAELDDQDGDRNGLVEIIVLHSGYAAEAVFNFGDCSTGAPSQDLIWSIAWSRTINEWNTKDGSFKIEGYTVASAIDHKDECANVKIGATMGVITHEVFHTIGAVDLYDPNFAQIGGLGAFDFMSSPYGPKRNPAVPGSASAYTKILLGWLTPIEITQDGVYEIDQAVTSDTVYIIRQGYAEGEYLLIENRQKARFDADFWGNGGMVIYHVDEAANKQQDRGYPEQLSWPENGNHYQVAVLPADGNYGIEKLENDGSEGYLFVSGATLEPGDGSTFPNTDSYQNGNVVSTGISISEISPSGPVMSFRVTGLAPVPNAPTSAPSVAEVATAAPTDKPTVTPTLVPTRIPTDAPTSAPTKAPITDVPTRSPVMRPGFTSAPSFKVYYIPPPPPISAPASDPADSSIRQSLLPLFAASPPEEVTTAPSFLASTVPSIAPVGAIVAVVAPTNVHNAEDTSEAFSRIPAFTLFLATSVFALVVIW